MKKKKFYRIGFCTKRVFNLIFADDHQTCLPKSRDLLQMWKLLKWWRHMKIRFGYDVTWRLYLNVTSHEDYICVWRHMKFIFKCDVTWRLYLDVTSHAVMHGFSNNLLATPNLSSKILWPSRNLTTLFVSVKIPPLLLTCFLPVWWNTR